MLCTPLAKNIAWAARALCAASKTESPLLRFPQYLEKLKKAM
jgi:hypothetical protein